MSNDKAQMSNQAQNPNDTKKYDLEERTAQFGGATIELVKTFPRNPINSPFISQIAGAGTSIGANYVEADGAESKKKQF
jgi:four helix bundle protein